MVNQKSASSNRGPRLCGDLGKAERHNSRAPEVCETRRGNLWESMTNILKKAEYAINLEIEDTIEVIELHRPKIGFQRAVGRHRGSDG